MGYAQPSSPPESHPVAKLAFGLGIRNPLLALLGAWEMPLGAEGVVPVELPEVPPFSLLAVGCVGVVLAAVARVWWVGPRSGELADVCMCGCMCEGAWVVGVGCGLDVGAGPGLVSRPLAGALLLLDTASGPPPPLLAAVAGPGAVATWRCMTAGELMD